MKRRRHPRGKAKTSRNCGRSRWVKKTPNGRRHWQTRLWKWIFSKVPCGKSRLYANSARTLAERHLRPNPGSNATARQAECGADVLFGKGEPCGILPMPETKGTPAGADRSAVDGAADRSRAPPAPGQPAHHARTEESRRGSNHKRKKAHQREGYF